MEDRDVNKTKKKKKKKRGGERVKLPIRLLKPVHCAPDMFKKFGQIPMGPYPFGIFKIRPKIRLGRRFENSKENQHEFWT